MSTRERTAPSPVPGRVKLAAFGIFVSGIAFFVNLPLIPLLYLEVAGSDGSALGAGFAVGITFVLSFLASPVWGALSDRFGPRPMAIRASIMVTFVYLGTALVGSVGALLALRAVAGLASGYVPAMSTLILQETDAERHPRAMALVSIARTSSALVGPALSGLAAWAFTVRGAFVLAAVWSVLATLVALALTGAQRPQRSTSPGPAEGGGGRDWSLGPVVAPLVMLLLVSSVGSAVPLLLSLPQVSSGISGQEVALGVGVILSAASVVSLLVATPWAGRAEKIGVPRATLEAAALGVVAFVGFLYDGSWWWLLVVVLLAAAATTEIGTFSQLLVVHALPAHATGRAMGTANAMTQLGGAVGSVAVGALLDLSDVLGRGFPALCMAAVLALAVAVSLRRSTAPAAEEVTS